MIITARQKEARNLIEQMIKTNQISENKTLSIGGFQHTNLYPLVKQWFNKEAIDVTSIKMTGMLHQYVKPTVEPAPRLGNLLFRLGINEAADLAAKFPIVWCAPVQCFGYHTSKERVGELAIEMVKIINDLSANKYVLASLESLLDLHLEDDSHVVVSYLAVDPEHEAIVKSIYGHCMFTEGRMPPEFP